METKDGFEWVSLKDGTCSCRWLVNGACNHIAEVRRWLYHFDRFLAFSALHKNIRRGDLNMVRSWANIILNHQKPQTLLKYVERVAFEETRAIPLWIQLRRKELTLDQALERITLSCKKWELGYMNQPTSHFENWYRGFTASFSRPTPMPLELSPLVRSAKTPAEIYCLYFDIRRDKSLRPHLLAILQNIADQSKDLRLKTFLKFAPSSSYEFMVLLEIYLGLYDVGAKEIHPKPKIIDPFIPMEQIFFHDIHTATGKARLREHFWSMFHAKNFQVGDVNLVWSGSLFSCLWRERCFQQKGSMKTPAGVDWHWQNVAIADSDYEKALELEGHYYSPFVTWLHQHRSTSPTKLR